MAFQSIEMKTLTDKLESQTEKYLELTSTYETKKQELMNALKNDDLDHLQSYDLLAFKVTLEDKRKAYKNIQITREEIKQRKIYEKANQTPKDSAEYYNLFITYWEQVHVVYSLKNSEFAAKKYRPVIDHQISMAKDKLKNISRLSNDNKNFNSISIGDDA